MSETARRKIELVVEVNIEQSKRALRTVTEEADKATKEITKKAKAAQKEELIGYGNTAREISRISAQLLRDKTASLNAGLNAAKKVYDAEAEQARRLAAIKKELDRQEAADLARKQKGLISLNGTLKVLGASYTALYVANTALDWAKQGAQIQALDKSYAHIGFTTKDLDATMEKLGYTLDKATVQRMSNLAHSFGFGQKEIQRFAEIARAASVKTGQDIKWMFESIVTGTARQSRLILDNLGILIKVGEANENYAKKLGTTADKLTDVQRKQAFVNEVMTQGQKIINDAPLDPLSQKIGRVASAWTEMGNAAKVAFANIAGGVIEAATGNYISPNKTREEQQSAHWAEQYRASKALEGGGQESLYSLGISRSYGDREKELNKLLDLADATAQLRAKVLGAAESDYESVRAEAAQELLDRLKHVEKLNWNSIQSAKTAAEIQKDSLKYLATEQDLRMKVDELRGNGLDKQEQETLSLSKAVDELNEFIRLRTEYNALIKRGVGALSPGEAPGVEPGSQGSPGAAPWAPTGRGLPQDKDSAFTNDPNSPGYPGSAYDNLSGQRGAAVGGPAETSDQAQRQEKTKRRGGRRAKPTWTGGPWWTGIDNALSDWDSGPGYWNAQGSIPQAPLTPMGMFLGAGGNMGRQMVDAETALQRARNNVGGYQTALDTYAPGAGRDAAREARDKAVALLGQKDPDALKAFEQERLSTWQEGASEASFAWANFMEDAEPDRLKAIGDAIHENIAKPTQIAADALKDLANGFAESTAAAIYEAKGLDAWKRMTNEFLKQLSRKAASSAIYEGAAALGSLAIGDVPGAVLHGKAAAAYGVVAVGFGVGAALTGGWQTHAPKDVAKVDDKKHADRGGPAARTGGDGRMMQQISNTYYISYAGLASDAAVRNMMLDILNSGVGSGARLDSRIIELR